MEPLDTWVTSNLALVTYLVMQEHELLETFWEEQYGRSSCSWLFEDSPELADDVAAFEGGNALVDPKSFNYIYGRLKRDMMSEKV